MPGSCGCLFAVETCSLSWRRHLSSPMKRALGARSYADDELEAVSPAFADWQAEANAAVESCSTLRNRRLWGEALYTRASVIFAVHAVRLRSGHG